MLHKIHLVWHKLFQVEHTKTLICKIYYDKNLSHLEDQLEDNHLRKHRTMYRNAKIENETNRNSLFPKMNYQAALSFCKMTNNY